MEGLWNYSNFKEASTQLEAEGEYGKGLRYEDGSFSAFFFTKCPYDRILELALGVVSSKKDNGKIWQVRKSL